MREERRIRSEEEDAPGPVVERLADDQREERATWAAAGEYDKNPQRAGENATSAEEAREERQSPSEGDDDQPDAHASCRDVGVINSTHRRQD